MPRIPKHPCGFPGCGVLVDYGTAYCPAHQVVYTERNREYDRTRTEAKFYHSAKWKRLRRWYLGTHPLCEMCGTELAKIVDHVEEIKDGGARYHVDNLQALCVACHNKKTFAEKRKRNEAGVGQNL